MGPNRCTCGLARLSCVLATVAIVSGVAVGGGPGIAARKPNNRPRYQPPVLPRQEEGARPAGGAAAADRSRPATAAPAGVGAPVVRAAAEIDRQVSARPPVAPVDYEHLGPPEFAPLPSGPAAYDAAACDAFPPACGCDQPVCGCEPPAWDHGCDAAYFGGGSDACVCRQLGIGIGGTCCGFCLPLRHTYASAELLLWWRRGQSLPPLATTSTAGVPADEIGVLGAAGTSILFGGERVGQDLSAGGRFTVGTWLDRRECNGLMLRFWSPGEQEIGFSADSADIPRLARPFLETGTPAGPASVVIAGGDRTGNINVFGKSDVYGGDLVLRQLVGRAFGGRLDLVFGYQTLRINEDLNITSFSDDPDLGGLRVRQTLRDSFDTENEFHAGTIGFMQHYRDGCWSLQTMLKIGFGNLQRNTRIAGSTTNQVGGGAPETFPTGLLAQETNRGETSTDTFAVSPEVNLAVGYRLRPHVDLSLGYSYVMVTDVVQPWRTIDPSLAVNSSATPPAATRPALVLTDGPYWVQGISFGLHWNY